MAAAAGDVLSGNGRLSLIENGATFDRAGVAFSDVTGAKLPAAASERHTELAGQPFRAMGTSVRGASGESICADVARQCAPVHGARRRGLVVRRRLRPDAGLSLRRRRAHLARGGARRLRCRPELRAYALLKEACDRYFYLPHRGETRGIGGLFADDLNDTTAEIGGNFEHCFALIRRIGDAYLDTYTRIVRARAGDAVRQRASRISSGCAAGATWNSTWPSIAARASGCSRRRAPNRC